MSQTSFTQPTPGEPPVDLTNVQGDVIYGLPKTFEHFFFFTIVKPDTFKENLSSLQFTTSDDIVKAREAILGLKAKTPGERLQLKLLNVAFSQKGLDALGIEGDLNDEAFTKGQLQDALALGDAPAMHGDPNKPNWKPAYFERIDGVFLAAGDCFTRTVEVLNDALNKLQGSVKEVYRLNGNTRPGDQRKNEHFGWLDGVSNPLIRGVPRPPNVPEGQGKVDPGVILLGQTGDYQKHTKNPRLRPKWAFEGSIMVFRELQQLVPEFDYFLEKNPYPVPLPPGIGKEVQGSRFMGRWKNGVPIELSPTSDDPRYLALDKINNFDFPQAPGDAGQEACPYSSHIRKMRPRSDIPVAEQEATRINRKGITYGPEVQPDEQSERTTMYERGLAFVCYQSNMSENGFRLLQMGWANNTHFLKAEKHMTIGYDPIIGQGNGLQRERNTAYRQDGSSIVLPADWVVPRGGEYFFTPSIKALKSVFAGKPYPE
ncbi:Dye-decolorizing peroxidase msp1 [Ceratobasidium sp. AG-Ba]|nr:Dye-decolorizing peroxidase msp1 [Ceratobasidium sp. AG-Ba]